MTLLRKWLFRLLLVAIAIIALLAAADNSVSVPLTFLDYQTFELPISWWILGAFVLGAIFGMLTNFLANTRLKLANRQSTKALAKTNQALDKANATVTPQSPGASVPAVIAE